MIYKFLRKKKCRSNEFLSFFSYPMEQLSTMISKVKVTAIQIIMMLVAKTVIMRTWNLLPNDGK